MSVGSLAKTPHRILALGSQWVHREYEKEHPGPLSIDDFVPWALQNGHVNLPKSDPLKQLKREARLAMRQLRVQVSRCRGGVLGTARLSPPNPASLRSPFGVSEFCDISPPNSSHAVFACGAEVGFGCCQ